MKSKQLLILLLLLPCCVIARKNYGVRVNAFGGAQWGNPEISEKIIGPYIVPPYNDSPISQGYKVFEGLEYQKPGSGWHAGLSCRFRYKNVYAEIQPQYTTFSVRYQFAVPPLPGDNLDFVFDISTQEVALPIIVGMQFVEGFRVYGGYIIGFVVSSENREVMEYNNYGLVKWPQSWLVGAGYDVNSHNPVLNRFSFDLNFTGNFTGNFAPTPAAFDIPTQFNNAFKNFYISISIGIKLYGIEF